MVVGVMDKLNFMCNVLTMTAGVFTCTEWIPGRQTAQVCHPAAHTQCSHRIP